MSNTRILPTDRHGRIYYGCTTFAQAERAIADRYDDETAVEVASRIADDMERAGYRRIATRLRKEYGVAL